MQAIEFEADAKGRMIEIPEVVKHSHPSI
ncbi:hypothetical protein CRENPOLYSF2_450008 [Crenothrix polyspora]|uniref:Uncharacterized protein n=1 Tax=Crenothrix polyspora TaxID=360316 RepID=A0A1R4HFJ7_9GAMM|nr:hypothetical protein CRENPOLYSF2_450008 [Crenothrix polyspora]